jgi:hypothetical protein
MTTLAELPVPTLPLRDGDTVYLLQAAPATTPDVALRMDALQRYVLGFSTTSLTGFYGANRIGQPASASQGTYTITLAAMTTTVGAAVAATAATQTTPWGFSTAAQANDLVARVNQLRTDVLEVKTRLDQIGVDGAASKTLADGIRSALVALGLIKGAA